MTDLSINADGEVAHAPFDPAGPGTTKWLHHRLVKVHELTGPVCADRLRDTLVGLAHRGQEQRTGIRQYAARIPGGCVGPVD